MFQLFQQLEIIEPEMIDHKNNQSIFVETYSDGVFLRTIKCGLLSFFKQAQQS